ncbi:hypothetical protein EZV62_005485 [Acer yangbiense]|uniref:F-box domain-containing protein n=1 Tax=Acer yangbiense TaxID=1000413 RepID=A0A5C7IMW1_9ROSI|nr:hypothetical protein EZV62_005485 [Acer yangbiense]
MSSGIRRQTVDAIANNDDLLTEILKHLPVKSLLRFKSVSKHWHSLISSPHFSRCLFPLVSGLFLQRPFCHPHFEFVPLKDMPINHTVKFPYILDFLPISSSLMITETSPHYKVVCVCRPDEENQPNNYQLEIYSSKTRSWRLDGDPFIVDASVRFRNGLFCNGAIHWVNWPGTSLYWNIDEVQLHEMPMPTTLIPEHRIRLRYFGESRRHLHLVDMYGPSSTKFIVYEMERDYSGWFVKYRVDVDGITIAFPKTIRSHHVHELFHNEEFNHEFSVLEIIREANEEESYMVLLTPGGKVIQYSFYDNTFKKIFDLSPCPKYRNCENLRDTMKFSCFEAYQYIGTLASVW